MGTLIGLVKNKIMLHNTKAKKKILVKLLAGLGWY